MNTFDQQNQQVNGNQYNAGGDINLLVEDKREKYYRIALNWDKKTSLRDFDLSSRNLESTDLSKADLTNANLSCANLRNTNLQNANLQNTNLLSAELENANLMGANFYNSNVDIEQLRTAIRLRKVRLPNGRIYDGRFNLKTDVEECREEAHWYGGAVRGTAILLAMIAQAVYPPETFAANWYGVSTEEYIEGQKWAKANGLTPFIPQYSPWLKRKIDL